ncbi:MAG: hypothetical protein ACI4XW_13160 [Candidatus Spyradocola sp.]
MRPLDELRSAFPEPDENFKACIRRTLDDLSVPPERRIIPMKRNHLSRKARIGALIAAATLLLTTIAAGAAAIHYNVFDFLNPIQAQPLPEATQLVQTPQATAQAAQSPVSFSVREALYDGVHANVLVAATPMDDSVLLLPADANPDYSVADLGLEGTQTIAQYAAEHGKTKLYSLSVIDQAALNGSEGFTTSLDFRTEPDGTLVICISGDHSAVQPGTPVELICTATPVDVNTGERDASATERTPLSFTLDSTGDPQQHTFATPTVYEHAGVTIQSVELKSTALGLYYTIHGKVTDKATFDALEDGLFFWFLDDNGEQLPGSAAVPGGSLSFPDENGEFVQEGALAPTETLPDSLTIAAINLWEDKALLDTHTIR